MNDILFDVERTKEEFLREELRGSRALLVNLMGRGVAILAAVEVILYYIRQDVTAHLRELGQLGAAELLPFARYSVGTVLLLVIAYIFARYTERVAQHHAMYRLQLVSMTPTFSGIAESIMPASPTQHYAFYAFPLFDLAVWLAFYAGELIGGSLSMAW